MAKDGLVRRCYLLKLALDFLKGWSVRDRKMYPHTDIGFDMDNTSNTGTHGTLVLPLDLLRCYMLCNLILANGVQPCVITMD